MTLVRQTARNWLATEAYYLARCNGVPRRNAKQPLRLLQLERVSDYAYWWLCDFRL